MNARTPSHLLPADPAISIARLSNAHLDALEEETIFILREVAAAFERPPCCFRAARTRW
jgi:sulfate adenylyltransferase subunit 2